MAVNPQEASRASPGRGAAFVPDPTRTIGYRTCRFIFEVIVGAILTQSPAWLNVEIAIGNLRKAGLLDPQALHPGTWMPSFAYLAPHELAALTAYLETLQ